MRRLVIASILLVASVALGQGFNDLFNPPTTPGVPSGAERCPPSNQWDAIDPTAVDVRTLSFQSRTLSAATAYRVDVISGTDNDPNGIVSSVAVSGTLFNFVLSPGGHEGNWYQLCAKPTDSNGRTPWGCGCIEIKRTRYARPR